MWSRPLLRHPGFLTCLLAGDLGWRQLLGWDGAQQSLPVQPQPEALHIYFSSCWGFGVSLGSCLWGAMEDDVLLSVLAGMSAVVTAPADNPFLTPKCQLIQFEFPGGLGGRWDRDAPAALVSPWSSACLVPPHSHLGAPVSPSGNQGS